MSELEDRLHRVMGSMVGNESLVASLDEDAAGELLSWGKSAAKRIVDETDGMSDNIADEQMAPRLRALRLMMRAVGRWVGEAQSLDEKSRLALWRRVGDQAKTLFGDSIDFPSMDDVLANLPYNANAAQVVALLITFIEDKGIKG
jgi:muconolactone delta-isomerase